MARQILLVLADRQRFLDCLASCEVGSKDWDMLLLADVQSWLRIVD